MCSGAYCFNVVAWMVLTILLKPSLAITAITLLAVPCAYAFFSFLALKKMKEAVLGSAEVSGNLQRAASPFRSPLSYLPPPASPLHAPPVPHPTPPYRQ
jgi:hypothetical protein